MTSPAGAERRKHRLAIARYGIKVCERAYAMNKLGEGSSNIGFTLGLTTQQADAAINAGRWLHEGRP